MSVLAKVVREATLDGLVEVALRILHEDGLPAERAAAMALLFNQPDDEAWERLLCRGLAAYLNDAVSTERHRPNSERFQVYRGKHGSAKLSDILESLYLSGADGRMKPLAQFSIKDAARWIVEAQTRAESWYARARLMKSIVDELNTHKAATVGALPEKRKEALRTKTMEVWA